MVGEVRLAGFTLTADEWNGFDAATREELLGAAGLSSDLDDEGIEALAPPYELVW